MSSSISRRTSGALGRTVSGRVARQVNREVDQVAGQAVVCAAEVEAGAYVTSVAMAYTIMITEAELKAAALYPERAYRFQSIADTYAALTNIQLQRMAFE